MLIPNNLSTLTSAASPSRWLIRLVLLLAILAVGAFGGHWIGMLQKDKAVNAMKEERDAVQKDFDDYRIEQNDKLHALEVQSSTKAQEAQQTIASLKGNNSTLWGKYQAALKGKTPPPPGCPASLSPETLEVIEQFRSNANAKIEGVQP
jgi:hypothetical protein